MGLKQSGMLHENQLKSNHQQRKVDNCLDPEFRADLCQHLFNSVISKVCYVLVCHTTVVLP